MVFESQLTTESVMEGTRIPKRIKVKSDLTDYRTGKPYEFEFQELPPDQLADDDILMYLIGKRGTLADDLHIGTKLAGMFNFFRNVGDSLESELLRAITVDRSGHVYESVQTLHGDEYHVSGFHYDSRIPRGHRLLAQIHNHWPISILESVEGFSGSDLGPHVSSDKSLKPPAMSAVVTTKGTWIAFSELPPTILDRIMGYLDYIYRINFTTKYDRMWGQLGKMPDDYVRGKMFSIAERTFGPMTGGYLDPKSFSEKQRLVFQKAVCKEFDLKLYFASKEESHRAKRIVQMKA